jgi:tetratricopeptide (TPR) repeat protein
MVAREPAEMTAAILAAALVLAQAEFRLRGRLEPGARAAITLHGSTRPFTDSAITLADGRFEFKNLLPGTYTLSVLVPARGEIRRTIAVGPGTATGRGVVDVEVKLEDGAFNRDALFSAHTVSAAELTVPDKAKRLFGEAQRRLNKRDAAGAMASLEEAVTIAPQFSIAWNTLGTIYYQTRQYEKAEQAFRHSLVADLDAYEPLVNLGGVLLNLNRPDEALPFNLNAVIIRPGDALANSQLGMTYFALGHPGLARKYLTEAKRIDPAHFSHPQLLLAEIYFHAGEKSAAADELEDFLTRHPDDPNAAAYRETVKKLRQ